jgi:glycosyltransferase involved in cell wall biosynthesis
VVRLGWEQAGLPLLVRRLVPDVLHSPHYTLPLVTSLGRRPGVVVTLHDATFFSHPELHLGTKAPFFRAWTRVATRRADALVVPSAATRDEVVRHTGVDAERIAVIPHGVDHKRFRPPTDDELAELRRWLGLDASQSYIAFLGTLEPRKNVPALVDAFIEASGERDHPPVLVLAGGKGWDESVDGALARVPSHLTVLRPGFLPDGLVPAYLGGADLVAYPAFGEGFGLPVLEAMACGAAVLTTRLLSLPEVGGDAVAYAESPQAADIAAALRELLDQPALRQQLGRAALLRAQTYTWEAAARAHLDVYQRVTR